MSRPSYVLKSSCTDTVGIVAAVTGFLAERGALITEMSHFVDDEAQKSFVRVEFEDDAIEDLQHKVASRLGFKLVRHKLELYGLCADCQAKR